MINVLVESLARPDAVLGSHELEYRVELGEMLATWRVGRVYNPSRRPIKHLDQTLIHELKRRGHPGLVLFSSGSTGEPKAALHDAALLMEKFKKPRQAKRMLFFMMLDHIGGINTALHSLANKGSLVTVPDRSPETIADAIERCKVQVLPTTPTFLNLLIFSGAHRHFDMSSLELITYGTEPMPESTLAAAVKAFPGVRFQQTYGLSELGILRSKSRGDNSLWVRIGGEGFETRVVDGLLEIKAQSAMLGYLNAPSPFTEDGWFKTGDAVQVDGEWLKILGRKSELINVGGEKVYPAEVESALQAIKGVMAAEVHGEPHPLSGQIVSATVQISTPETLVEFRKRMREELGVFMAAYKIPQRVALTSNVLHTERFKKARAHV